MDDILLASSDVNLLLATKKFLSSNFDIKNLGEASFVLGIEIHRDLGNFNAPGTNMRSIK